MFHKLNYLLRLRDPATLGITHFVATRKCNTNLFFFYFFLKKKTEASVCLVIEMAKKKKRVISLCMDSKYLQNSASDEIATY